MSFLTPTPSTDCLNRHEFSSVYSPAEDSFLFLDALESDVDFIRNRLKPTLSIEVGSGSGIISAFLSKLLGRTCAYLCIDVSFQACLATKQVFTDNNVKLLDSICANLFSSLRSSSVGLADIVLFNPPYVPTEENELLKAKSTLSAAWAGGPKGRMVIDAFIKQVEPFLSKSGVLYILLLRENDPDEVASLIKLVTNGRLSESKCVHQRRCGTEHLFVYRFYYPGVDPVIGVK
nr:hemK methyltransferase family [Hymenolepis microstoma]